jgi:hypothetical protein
VLPPVVVGLGFVGAFRQWVAIGDGPDGPVLGRCCELGDVGAQGSHMGANNSAPAGQSNRAGSCPGLTRSSRNAAARGGEAIAGSRPPGNDDAPDIYLSGALEPHIYSPSLGGVIVVRKFS